MMSVAMSSLLSLLFLFTTVLANTEKTIFLGPEPVPVPVTHPTTLSNLRLHTLTPANGTLRTQLRAQFPSPAQPQGATTWLILDNLTPEQRYEVRVCWPAVQPTDFTLSTFPLSTVWDSPELLASLHAYSASQQQQQQQQSDGPSLSTSKEGDSSEREASILLLRILAAADYFTPDAALMSSVPPVDVDIILDPFLLNVLPRSIAGTACYIVGVAVVAYLVAGGVASRIRGLIARSSGGSGRDADRDGSKKKQ